MIETLAFPPPPAFGLPDQFQVWRPHQVQAWQTIVDAETGYVAIPAPTGSGKTLIYMTAGHLIGGRIVVLTGFKGLQDQVGMEFAEMGIHDVRGQNNYTCHAYQPGGEWQNLAPDDAKDQGCDNGPCHVGLPCTLREAGCSYYDAVRMGMQAQLISTNYAWWLAQRRYSQGFGEVDLLVLDEAHVAGEELSKALQIKLDKWLCNALSINPPEDKTSIVGWAKWALWHANSLKSILDTRPASSSQGSIKHRKRIQVAERILRTMSQMGPGDWIPDHTQDSWVFECLNPASYAQSLLFQGAKKVVLTSATLTEKTLDLLGIPKNDVTWFECPSHFPINRRPVIYVPTVRMTQAQMTEAHWNAWIDRIDQILDQRPWVKGIIHTVSYARARRLLAGTKHKGRMMMPSPGQTGVMDLFKSTSEPFVLVSPAVMTGWDFPGDQCRFQIIAKLPFPDSTSQIVKARTALDKDYSTHLMMQSLVQAVGRGMRSADDWCETLIIDDNWTWVQSKYRKFAPTWFWDAVKKSITLPAPLSFPKAA